MKTFIKITLIVLSTVFLYFSSYATYVCTANQAALEAEDRWNGYVLQIIYDPDRDGYWIIMIDRRGREKVKYMPSDC